MGGVGVGWGGPWKVKEHSLRPWTSRKMWEVHPMLDSCWDSVCDAGPAWIQHRGSFPSPWTQRCAVTTEHTRIQTFENITKINVDMSKTTGIIQRWTMTMTIEDYTFYNMVWPGFEQTNQTIKCKIFFSSRLICFWRLWSLYRNSTVNVLPIFIT